MCSSGEVSNSLLDDIGRRIKREQGLISLEIERFKDKHSLMEWPLSQLAIKSQFLRHFKLYRLDLTTAENRSALIKFACEVCLHSDNLETLHF